MQEGEATSEARERFARLLDSNAGVVFVHTACAVVFTWPLARLASDRIPGGASDIWQCYWNFWWWRTALVDLGTSPLWTDLLFHPHGASLVLHTHSFFNQIVAFPVNLMAGPASALNFATLLTFVLAGIAAHQLAWELTKNRSAGFIAGLIFAFFPHHFEQSLEHMNLASIQFLPWIALYGLRMAQGGSRRDALLFGLCFALNALSCWHYGVFTLFFVPILWLAALLRAEDSLAALRTLFGRGLVALVPFALLMAPIAILMALDAGEAENYLKAPMNKGIDLAHFFAPSDHHPILGAFTWGFYAATRTYASVGSQGFLGWTPLFLAACAWIFGRRDHQTVAWTVIAGLAFVLALGAQPIVAGRTLELPLPHMQFKYIPLLDALRVANRFVVITMLALSVLAALGFAARFAQARRAGWIFAGLVAFEFLWLPYPMMPVAFSPLITQIGEEAEGAVLHIPFTDHSLSAMNLAYQTEHRRPMAAGYISVAPRGEAALGNDPVLWHLSGQIPRPPDEAGIAHLRRLGFSHVILHKDRTHEALHESQKALPAGSDFYDRRRERPALGISRAALDAVSAALERMLGRPEFEDSRVRIFRLTPRS